MAKSQASNKDWWVSIGVFGVKNKVVVQWHSQSKAIRFRYAGETEYKMSAHSAPTAKAARTLALTVFD